MRFGFPQKHESHKEAQNAPRFLQIYLYLLCFFVALFLTFVETPQAQSEAQSQASPTPSPSPSPSPSPTPITGLHQWGAVTLFHGLPSDRVHAITQTADGAMWFGTEAGLAKFDGRRILAINDSSLPAGRVLALQADENGALWVGTESGAARFSAGTVMRELLKIRTLRRRSSRPLLR